MKCCSLFSIVILALMAAVAVSDAAFVVPSPAYAFAYPYAPAPVVLVRHHTPEHTEKQKEEKENEVEQPQLPDVYKLYPYSIPVAVVSPLSLPGVQSGYHAQDELGQYQYGYSSPLSAKNEIKTFDGVTRGSYSYVDANGELQNVNYVSDALGFRVAATNVPEQVKPVDIPDAPEVAEAKAKLFALQQEHIAKVKAAGASLPADVEDASVEDAAVEAN